jgi:hypothetical protein
MEPSADTMRVAAAAVNAAAFFVFDNSMKTPFS